MPHPHPLQTRHPRRRDAPHHARHPAPASAEQLRALGPSPSRASDSACWRAPPPPPPPAPPAPPACRAPRLQTARAHSPSPTPLRPHPSQAPRPPSTEPTPLPRPRSPPSCLRRRSPCRVWTLSSSPCSPLLSVSAAHQYEPHRSPAPSPAVLRFQPSGAHYCGLMSVIPHSRTLPLQRTSLCVPPLPESLPPHSQALASLFPHYVPCPGSACDWLPLPPHSRTLPFQETSLFLPPRLAPLFPHSRALSSSSPRHAPGSGSGAGSSSHPSDSQDAAAQNQPRSYFHPSVVGPPGAPAPCSTAFVSSRLAQLRAKPGGGHLQPCVLQAQPDSLPVAQTQHSPS
eukprot:1723816-Rhodomonas_salina.1